MSSVGYALNLIMIEAKKKLVSIYDIAFVKYSFTGISKM